MLRPRRSKINRRVMDEQHTKLSDLVIGSVDTLRGSDIDQLIPAEWNCDPPVLLKVQRPRIKDQPSQEEKDALLKGMLRVGIPTALRCAVWLSNIIQSIHPQQNSAYWLEYRTLSKVRILDAAYDTVLKQILGIGSSTSTDTAVDILKNDTTDWNQLTGNSYGRRKRTNDVIMSIDGIVPNGQVAFKRVLIAIDCIVTTDYAPLIPSIVAVLLTVMSESYVFCSIREMLHQSARWYFPVSQREHDAWCRAFVDIMKKLHPSTAEYLDDRGVFDSGGLAPIFENFFIDILPMKYIQRIMDLYTLEGSKVLYRFGVSLLVLYKIESAEQLITISNAKEWWTTMKHWTFNTKRFQFDTVVQKAYGVHGRGLRRMMKFPRRRIIQRLIRLEEQYLQYEHEDDDDDDDNNNNENSAVAHPLGLVGPEPSQSGNELEKPVLAQSIVVRTLLTKWLPITLRLNNLHLLYSTNYHGRTLERFYTHVKSSTHTVLICEVLDKSTDQQQQQQQQPTIIGMYASQAWRVSTHVYGDGGVFLFRLQPNPTCWKWHPIKRGGVTGTTRSSMLENVNLDDDSNSGKVNTTSTNQTALLEQFMVGTSQFFSMGGNPDGSCGLRINEDLTKGESSTASGFDNEPLHGLNKGSVFDIGLVEVYGFVRQIDGKSL